MLSRRALGKVIAMAAGGSTPRRPDQYESPPGTGGLGAGFRSSTVGRFRIIFVGGPSGGVFVYSGAPAFGNLIGSVAGAPGFDPYGNAFLDGLTSYQVNPASFAVSLTGNVAGFFSAPGPAGPWSPGPSMGYSGGPIQLGGGGNAFAQLEIDGAALPLVPQLALIGGSAGDRSLGIEVAGDGNFRYRMDTNGLALWGPGSAVVDVGLGRMGTGQLGTDLLAATTALGGPAETWHTPGLGTAWTNVGSPYANVQYAFDPTGVGGNRVWIRGRVNVGTGTNIFTLPAAYHPAFTAIWTPGQVTGAGGENTFIQVMGTADTNPGTVRLVNPGALTVVDIAGDFPLD